LQVDDGPTGDVGRRGEERARSRRWWYLLLLIPFVALLYPPLYAFDEPRLFGMPFFYWYQFLWLFLSAGIVTIVYRATR
jgi:hypothetical protein